MSKLDLISIIDVESTGLTPTTDELIEIGCVLFSLSHNTVLQQVSTLVPVGMNVNPAEHINGISASSANLVQTPDDNSVLHSALSMCLQADAFVAHNAQFDRNFLECFINAHDYSYDYPLLSKPWIDSMAITWPRATRHASSLRDLAGDYSIPVWKPHRALTDCVLLAEILQAEPRAKELLEKELEPKVWVVAGLVSKGSEELRNLAKDQGFRWEGGDGQTPGYFSQRMHPSDVMDLPLEIGPVITDPSKWVWAFLDCGKEDKQIHSLAKEWGFRFNHDSHPIPYKWMRRMDKDHAIRLRTSEGLPVIYLALEEDWGPLVPEDERWAKSF